MIFMEEEMDEPGSRMRSRPSPGRFNAGDKKLGCIYICDICAKESNHSVVVGHASGNLVP